VLATALGDEKDGRVEDRPFEFGRRRFMRVVVAAPLALALARHGLAPGEGLLAAAAPAVSPTPECGDDDEPTPGGTAGPFFKPRSPERASLVERGMAGTRLEVAGRVFGRDCRPMAGALLDFWQADDDGEYDNAGYRLRGHQFADADGRYRLSTILPGLYPGRTRHIHVRVQPRGGQILTTQLYFPGETRNQRDGLFRPELLMSVPEKTGDPRATFHFVLDAV
jgi:protocatechuate 3,4-dioxygenase beta subunit